MKHEACWKGAAWVYVWKGIYKSSHQIGSLKIYREQSGEILSSLHRISKKEKRIRDRGNDLLRHSYFITHWNFHVDKIWEPLRWHFHAMKKYYDRSFKIYEPSKFIWTANKILPISLMSIRGRNRTACQLVAVGVKSLYIMISEQ